MCSSTWPRDMCLGYANTPSPGMILTPEDFKKRSHLDHHAFGGCPPRLDKTPPPHRTPVEGLWFVGAQSEAYGGVTGAMKSGDNVARMMLSR